MKEDELRQWQEELRKCNDPVYFYANYLMIKTSDGKMVVPKPLTDEDKLYMREWVINNK